MLSKDVAAMDVAAMVIAHVLVSRRSEKTTDVLIDFPIR